MWRDDTPQQTKDELDGLKKPAMTHVEVELDTHGRFEPFAVVLTRAGEHELITSEPRQDDAEPSDGLAEVISLINAKAADIKAAVLASAVQLGDNNTDAVRLLFDHEDGTTASVLAPYPEAHRR